MTVKEAAAYLNVSKRTIYWWVESGVLPHLKFGRVLRLEAADLEEFRRAARRPARR